MVRMSRMDGDFGSGGILGSISLLYRDNGVCNLMKRGNSKGAILFGSVYNFLSYSRKAVAIGNGIVKGSGSVLASTKVVVRSPNFLQA